MYSNNTSLYGLWFESKIYISDLRFIDIYTCFVRRLFYSIIIHFGY